MRARRKGVSGKKRGIKKGRSSDVGKRLRTSRGQVHHGNNGWVKIREKNPIVKREAFYWQQKG